MVLVLQLDHQQATEPLDAPAHADVSAPVELAHDPLEDPGAELWAALVAEHQPAGVGVEQEGEGLVECAGQMRGDLVRPDAAGVVDQREVGDAGAFVVTGAVGVGKQRRESGDGLVARLGRLLTDAYRTGDHERARVAYLALIDHARSVGADKVAAHLASALDEALTFLLHPDAGRLGFGHKGRPELGSGVLERVMRELNRRTDVGVRWSIDGLRRLLMIKLQHKYHQGPWSPSVTAPPTPTVRFSLAA